MSFVDREIVCVDCSQGFVFTAGEQDFYERKGFKEEPKRCKPCRETRKQRRNDAPVTARAPRPANGGTNGHASNGALAGGNGFGFRGGGDDLEASNDSLGNRAVADVDDDDIGNRAPGNGASPARPRPQAMRNGASAGNGAANGTGNGAGGGARPERARGSDRGGGGAERRGERAERRELHDATCATCGAAARVPFKPVPGRPVYCKDCYASRAASAGGR